MITEGYHGLKEQDWKFSEGLQLAANVTQIGAKPRMTSNALLVHSRAFGNPPRGKYLCGQRLIR
jgi:hypothetical protein